MKLLAFVALTLVCGTAAARDVGQIPANSDPKISTWFRTAKSPSGTACCDEADGYREGVPVKVAGGEPTVIFRSWWATSDGYHLSLVDPSDLRSLHLIWDGPVVRDNPPAAPLCGCRGRTASCWCAASRLAQRPE
jgi:hypothetical protein